MNSKDDDKIHHFLLTVEEYLKISSYPNNKLL
jgi:hypothetical protein